MTTESESGSEPVTEWIEGIDYTVESGFFVFTAAGLLKRGYCCDSGCRNCPYPQTTRPESSPE